MKSSLVAAFLSSSDKGASPDYAPLSPYMVQVWHRHKFERTLPLEDVAARTKYVFWYLNTFQRGRAPYRWPLPRDLELWLNQPAIDLSIYVSTIPTLNGQRGIRKAVRLSRWMSHVWHEHGRDFNIFDPQGLCEFIAWYAYRIVPEWNAPRNLLTPEIVDLLNEPAADASVPLSMGMFLNSKHLFAPEAHTWTRAQLYAKCFEALLPILNAGVPRLIPDYVSNFWSAPPFTDSPRVTSFEYLAARTDPSSGVAAGFGGMLWEQEQLREWFRTTYTHKHPGSVYFSGYSPSLAQSPNQALPPAKHPESTVFLYRDHVTPCGLTTAGEWASAALAGVQGLNVFEVDFAYPRGRMNDEHQYNESRFAFSGRNLHLLNMNPEYVPESLICNIAKVQADDYIIGQFYWELSDISRVHECGLELADEVWVSTEYLREIYAAHTQKPVIRMGQVLERTPITSMMSRVHFNVDEHAYTFLFTFDSGSVIERKNPLAAVQAFRRAFPRGNENARLILKTRNVSGSHGATDHDHWLRVLALARVDDRILLIDATYTDEEMAALRELCDCYISLHRSEGFGFGPAEAMAIGKPVIATNYSGVCDFCRPDTALLVDYKLQRVPQGLYPYMDPDREYHWADPNVDSAAVYMRRLYQNPDLGSALGANGSELMRREYSLAALRRRYLDRMCQLGFFKFNTLAVTPRLVHAQKTA